MFKVKSVINRHVAVSVSSLIVLSFSTTTALSLPITTEMQKYLVIGTGDGIESFDSDGVELGANQEVVSSGAPESSSQQVNQYYNTDVDLTGTFTANPGQHVGNSDNRWVDQDTGKAGSNNDTAGLVDWLPGAKLLQEPPDQSGNVAITGKGATFTSENSDYHASIGIQCIDASSCDDTDGQTNAWFGPPNPNTPVDLADNGDGISDFDPTTLNSELASMKDAIFDNASADYIGTDGYSLGGGSDFEIANESYKSGSMPFVIDLDAIDNNGNNDGIAVIDIDVGTGKFSFNNSDIILYSTEDTLGIFRMNSAGFFDFSNSSVMMGPGCVDGNGDPLENTLLCDITDGYMGMSNVITDLGAIFAFGDNGFGGDQAFNFNNVILGGIGLWDFDMSNSTKLTINNGQGCVQLISERVELSSSNRYNRCSLGSRTPPPNDVPEPTTFGLLVVGLAGASAIRRKRKPVDR